MTIRPWKILPSGRVEWAPKRPPSKAMADVLAERVRQIDDEGWDTDHDDEHSDGSLAAAAACYAFQASINNGADKGLADERPGYLSLIDAMWPRSWDWCWWKPKTKRRNLVRAGALIIAELERMDRAEALLD